MSRVFTLSVAVALVAGVAFAEEIKSGLQPGERIPAFDVVKVAGAVDDGVDVGDQLCYRCKYGARPMVMVFTRSTDKSVAELAQQLNDLVAKNSEQQLRAFVNVIGENRDALETSAKKFGTSNKLSNVPVVVPVEFENGPGNYGVTETAEVTVILAKGSKVIANHAFAPGKFDEAGVKSVVGSVPQLLK